MPTVQAPPGQSAFSTETPRVSPSLEDFGGGQAARPVDLSGVARGVAQIRAEGLQHANEIAVTDAGSQLSKLETTLLWDPQTGAMTRKGKDAFGAQDDAQKAWTTQTAAIEDGLANDDQKLAFRRMVAAHGAALGEQLTRHAATEKEAYDGEVTDGYVTNERNAAIANYTDPQRITESVGNQQAALADYARRTGKPADWLQQHALQAASDTHVAVIERLLANDQDVAAKAYRDAHADQIVGAHAAALDRALEEGTSRAASQAATDRILADGGTLTEQIAKAREEQDPRVRDLTEQRLRRNDAESKAAAREQAESDMTTAGNILDRTNGDLTKIPPSIWSSFSPAQKASLKSYADGVVGGPGKQTTDLTTWVSLRTMAANPATRDAFLKLDPMSYAGKLSPADFKGIVELRDGIKKGDDHTAATLDDVNVRSGVITNTLRGIGMLVDPKSGRVEKPEAAIVYRSVDDAVESFQEDHKRKATTKEIQQIADEVVTSHVVSSPGMLWGTNETTKRLFEMKPEDALVITSGDISPANKQAIAASLRRRGLPVTEQTVVQAYRDHLSGLVHRGPR